jgi:hypothetical protein
MIKGSRGLHLNTIILAIIAIVVLVFLIGEFIPQIPNQPTPPHHPIPSPNQIKIAQCTQYASAMQTEMGVSTNSSTQLELLASSQYVSYNCSISIQYAFTLYNGSEVICGLNSSYCINLQGSGCNHCTPPGCIPGCELQ